MRIGHINLARSFNGNGEHFIALVEALDRRDIEQHVIARNEALARRVAVYDQVSAGPTTATAIIACCLMPAVDVVHCHDHRAGRAGLLLALTRSIPFVLTRRIGADPMQNPVRRSVYGRAATIICATDAGARALSRFAPACRVEVINDIARAAADDFDGVAMRVAGEHLRTYRRATGAARVPALSL